MKVESFANRLKQAMNIANVKQIDLANRTNIDKSLINKYIKGVAEAGNDNLPLIAKALNVSEVWLMGYDVPCFTQEEQHQISKTNWKSMNTIKQHFDTELDYIRWQNLNTLKFLVNNTSNLQKLTTNFEDLEDVIPLYSVLINDNIIKDNHNINDEDQFRIITYIENNIDSINRILIDKTKSSMAYSQYKINYVFDDEEVDSMDEYRLLFDKDERLTPEQKEFFIDMIETQHRKFDEAQENGNVN